MDQLLKNNPKGGGRPPPGLLKRRPSHADYWQIHFAELPRQNGDWCILVLVNTFLG